GPRGHQVPVVGLDELLERSRTHPDRFEDRGCDEESPAAILFTSGTTGRPKGAVLTQGNLVFGCTTLNRVWGIGRDDVLVHPLPLFHVHGLFVAAYCALTAGATTRLLPSFEVGAVLDALATGTVFMGVPTHYTRLLADERLTADLVRGVRLFVSGSAPMRPSTHEAFTARTGHRILERYGTTETGMIASNPLEGERRVGTVGPALPGVEVRIAGTPPGPVEVRGPNVLADYWNRPDQPARGPDGFFDTGDLGRLHPDGYLEIVGRAKDLVITGGLNVYPKEVEQAIDALDGVEESAVVGVSDPDFGEVVVAVVVARPGAEVAPDAVRAALRNVLAPYKVPKRVVLATALARNAVGKVEKVRLRRALEDGAGPLG
ncbi:MAG TPA: AMP-binding protein, partial [Acidimicrobiales bacterium]|nr:AMP-binding protein [Acidimicrobiales bacterium]